MDTAPRMDGEALRAARERSGMTQAQLARRLGLAGGERVSMWERGQADPRTAHLLHAVASALGVRPASLLVPPDPGPGLRWLRYAAGLSIEELASQTHMAVVTLRRWESAGLRRRPDTAVLEALAGALGADVEQVAAALTRS